VVGADHAQIVGAPALHEAQIAGVIDDAGEITVDSIATWRCGNGPLGGGLGAGTINPRRIVGLDANLHVREVDLSKSEGRFG
jgi:hypothetical protein